MVGIRSSRPPGQWDPWGMVLSAGRRSGHGPGEGAGRRQRTLNPPGPSVKPIPIDCDPGRAIRMTPPPGRFSGPRAPPSRLAGRPEAHGRDRAVAPRRFRSGRNGREPGSSAMGPEADQKGSRPTGVGTATPALADAEIKCNRKICKSIVFN